MLGLKLPTDPRWANLAQHSLESILTDHAYCEQKAASTCISIIQNWPDKERLVEELSPIVTEEWGHFRLVLDQLKKRGLSLGKQRIDFYVRDLMAWSKRTKGNSVNDHLLDTLLLSAMIEARSCERFKLLSEQLEDKELKEFYKKLMISEAGHYTLFISLAKEYVPHNQVDKRWAEWLHFEAELIQRMKVRGDRIH